MTCSNRRSFRQISVKPHRPGSHERTLEVEHRSLDHSANNSPLTFHTCRYRLECARYSSRPVCPDPCDPSPCDMNASCAPTTIVGDAPTCTCNEGYTGDGVYCDSEGGQNVRGIRPSVLCFFHEGPILACLHSVDLAAVEYSRVREFVNL